MQVNIFDRYNKPTKKLIHSLTTAGNERKNLFVHYDGELPKESLNPFTYFTGVDDDLEDHNGLFFNQIKVPEFYAIRHIDGGSANIEYFKNVVGKIHYRAEGYRLVDTVDWYSAENHQSVVKKDRYNLAGQHYATTYFSSKGAYQTDYYNVTGKLIIREDLVHRSLRLYNQKTVYHFDNLTQFFVYFLKMAKIKVSDIYINSLSFPLFISRKLEIGQATTLFWQEALGQEVPGNMMHELEDPKTLKQIIFMSESQLDQVEQQYPKTSVALNYLSPIGEFTRANRFRMRGFILTNSDNIHGLRDVLMTLPELKITVAAYTNMSTKLIHMAEEFNNLTLVPSINEETLNQELEQSDIYLDINYGVKVDHILDRAYQQHMIIFSYKEVTQKDTNTLIFDDTRDLCNNLSYILTDRTNWQRLLTKMVEKDGHLSTILDYQSVLDL